MTKVEKLQIELALADLMTDDSEDFSNGIERLCKLIGRDYPAARILRGCKNVDIREVAAGQDNREFSVTDLVVDKATVAGTAHTCFICHKPKGQPPDGCPGHYQTSGTESISGTRWACQISKETH